MTKQQIRQLQTLQQDPRWDVVEQVLDEYIKKHFTQSTVKRDTEFNTIWEAAYDEGGKYHLQKFFNDIEQECLKDIL